MKYNKVIKKATATGYHIPIIQRVAVKNGKAYATNLDAWAITNTEMADGIYDKQVLDYESNADQFKTDDTLQDFPELDTSEREHIGTLSARDIERVLKARKHISTDTTRPALCCVFLHDDYVEASDGYTAYIGKLTQPVKQPVFLIKPLLDLMSLSKCKEFELYLANDSVVLTTDGLELIGKNIDYQFPNLMELIPHDTIRDFKDLTTDPKQFAKQIKASEQVLLSDEQAELVIGEAHIPLAVKFEQTDYGNIDTDKLDEVVIIMPLVDRANPEKRLYNGRYMKRSVDIFKGQVCLIRGKSGMAPTIVIPTEVK